LLSQQPADGVLANAWCADEVDTGVLHSLTIRSPTT
jgi:hypothetical protein